MAELDPHYFPNLKDSLSKIALDNITSVTLNTDALKVNFEAIVAILKGLVKRVDVDQDTAKQNERDVKDLREKLAQLENNQNNLNEKISNTDSQVKETQQNTDQNTQDIQKLQDALKDLKDSNNDLNKAFENSQNDLKEAQKKLDNHDQQIRDLLQQINASDRNGPKTPVPSGFNSNSQREVDNLKKDMDDLRNNFENQIADLRQLLEDFVTKDEFNGFRDQTDNKLQSHQESIDDLYNQIRDLSSRISDKLDCENFDEHLNDYNNIKNMVISLANKGGSGGDQKTTVVQQLVQSGSSLSTKDANMLKELTQKFPEIEALLKKLNKEFNEHVITFKTYADEANRKIHANDENTKTLKADTNKKITELEQAIRSLRDQILNFSMLPVPTSGSSNTSNTTNTNTNTQGGNDNSGEFRRIQMALTTINERISSVENNVSELQKLKEKVNGIQEVTYENKHKIGNIEEELAELRGLRSRLEVLEQAFRDREREIKSSGGKGGRTNIVDVHNVGGSGGLTHEQVKHMIDEEINKLRDEILALIESLRAEIAKKADAEDLWKSEAALLEKLDQIAGALMKRSQADKNDTKKALMFLEKKIKEITVVLFGGPAQGEDGAMFAKKPWNPWSCASCDSKLKELPGSLLDTKNWNKMPQRETSPGKLTQGKFGKGWAKWADGKKSSSEKHREPFSGGKGDTLPEINNREYAKGQNDLSARDNE